MRSHLLCFAAPFHPFDHSFAFSDLLVLFFSLSIEQKKRSFSSMETPAFVSRGMASETPGATPAKRSKLSESESQGQHKEDNNELTRDAKTMSLDAFLSKYTSEDDASFAKLMDKQISAARRAYKEVNERATQMHHKMLESGRLIGWREYDPKHSGVLKIPDAIARTFTADEMKANEKAVVPENTRFPEGGPSWKRAEGEGNNERQNASSQSTASSSSGNFKTPLAPSESNMDARLYQDIIERRKAAESGTAIFGEIEDMDGPVVRGYRMVTTPSVNPNNVDQSPLITWGEIDEVVKLDEFDLPAIPMPSGPIDDTSSSSSGFSVPPVSYRSVVANKLTAAKKKKAPTNSNLGQSPLLARAAALKTPSLFQMTPDLQLRSSYASTPIIRTPGSTPSGLKSGATATPSRSTPRK